MRQLESDHVQMAQQSSNDRLLAQHMQQKAADWERECRMEKTTHLDTKELNQQQKAEIDEQHRARMEDQTRSREVSKQLNSGRVRFKASSPTLLRLINYLCHLSACAVNSATEQRAVGVTGEA